MLYGAIEKTGLRLLAIARVLVADDRAKFVDIVPKPVQSDQRTTSTDHSWDCAALAKRTVYFFRMLSSL